MNRLMRLLFITAIPLFAGGEAELILDGSHSVYGVTDIVAGISFPPFANSEQINFTTTELKKLAIDRIRIAVDWRNREPSEGEFYWVPMDYRMEAAAKNNIAVCLTINSICPDWALIGTGEDGAFFFDENALENFIEALLTRYENIDKIQFGNEWEAGTEDGTTYTSQDSVEKFIIYTNILYNAVQRLSPDTKVVLGGLTRTYPIMEYFASNNSYPDFSGIELANGATVEHLKKRIDKLKANYDSKLIKENVERVLQDVEYNIIDIHLYDDPENWPKYLSVLPEGKEVLVSEFGGPNSEFENTSPHYQAKRMEDYINAIEQLPITEAYYFKLVDSRYSYHQDSGLFYESLRMKPARNVFARRLTSSW
ncbi:MAG: hypothetical protein ACLFST_09855 [Spirochaetia bacterium]